MLFTVASQFREHPRSLEVVRFERVTWRDRCLEIRRRGECRREPTPGYRLRLTRRGQTYEYRAPLASPTDVALAAAPDPRIGAPALAWNWSPASGDCQTLLISTDARPAVGWCDGPIAEVEWPSELRSRDEWAYLYSRFTPFRLVSGDRTLVFNGTGTETASPPWRRARSVGVAALVRASRRPERRRVRPRHGLPPADRQPRWLLRHPRGHGVWSRVRRIGALRRRRRRSGPMGVAE